MNHMRRVASPVENRRCKDKQTYTLELFGLRSFKLSQSRVVVVAAILIFVAGIFCVVGIWGVQHAEP